MRGGQAPTPGYFTGPHRGKGPVSCRRNQGHDTEGGHAVPKWALMEVIRAPPCGQGLHQQSSDTINIQQGHTFLAKNLNQAKNT